MLCLSGFELYSRWVPLIKVTTVRQMIKLNPLYTLSTMINVFHAKIILVFLLLNVE